MKSVFISSTFKDMQAERDLLHERIFPALRKIIGEYGEDIQELDLRWGVDTIEMSEEESGHQVLRVCIDAIDRCHPYIIVLLGERYGWIPDERLVESLRDERVNAWYEKQMSITNLEIKYGALSEEETLKNCIFCFRDPHLTEKIDESYRPVYASESPMHRERLNALKDQIRKKTNAVILDYEAGWDPEAKKICSLEDFGERLYELLVQMIRRDFAKAAAKNPMERLFLQMERTKERYLSSYVVRYREEFEIFDRILFYDKLKGGLSEKNLHRILLKGGAGSGKSALMASVAHALEEHGCETILYFSDNSGCQSLETLKDYVIYRLEEICGLPHEESASRDDRLRFLSEKTKERKIYCVIDAIDQLFENTEGARLELPELCPNLYYILSSLSGFPAEETVKTSIYPFVVCRTENFTMAERKQMIGRTALKRGKKLDDMLVKMTVEESGAGNPLYLSMLLQRYFMMDQKEFEAAEMLAPGMEGLHRYMEKLLIEMPDQAEPMVNYLLFVTGQRFQVAWFQEILGLLALSRFGLSEKELEGLLSVGGMRFLQVEFQQLVSYLYDAFTCREDGKWTFAHRLFKEAVLHEMSGEDREKERRLLVDYSLQNSEFLEREGFYYVLEQRHPAGLEVLEQSGKWRTKQEVLDFVGGLTANDSSYHAWFTELNDKVQSASLCKFWLSFDFNNYQPEFCDFLQGVLNQTLQKETLSDKYRYRCALKLAEYHFTVKRRQKTAFSYLEQAEQLCRRMPGAEKCRRLSRIYAKRAMWRMSFGGRKEWETARTEFEAAVKLLEPFLITGDQTERKACVRQDIINKINYAQFCGDYRGDYLENLLTGCLKELEPYVEDGADEGFERMNVDLHSMITRAYQARGHFDWGKSTAYGQKAMELSEGLVQKAPSLRNMELRLTAIQNYACCYRAEYQHPYLEEALFVTRKIFDSYPTDYRKERLADALCSFAGAADDAVENRNEVFSEELLNKAERSWKEGFSFYEELLKTNSVRGARYGYVLFLIRRAEIVWKRGYRMQAQKYAKRGRALIYESIQRKEEDEFCQMERELRDLDLIIAETYDESCQAKEALPYAEEGLRMALKRQEIKGKVFQQTARLWMTYTRTLYYLRMDGEALSACEEARRAYAALSGGLESEEAKKSCRELSYIQSRIFLEQGRRAEAAERLQSFEAYCGGEKTSWEYGQLLILKADYLAIAGKEKEAEELFDEAVCFWSLRSKQEKEWMKECRQYFVYERKGRIYRSRCRAESGYYKRAVYYQMYSLCRKAELAGTEEGEIASMPVCIENTREASVYAERIWLPANLPAFASLTARMPENGKEKQMFSGAFEEAEINPEKQAAYITLQVERKQLSAADAIEKASRLYERLWSVYGDYTVLSCQSKELAEQFQVEEERPGKSAVLTREQKWLFAEEGLRGNRAWYPLLKLLEIAYRSRSSLDKEALEELYRLSRACFLNAGWYENQEREYEDKKNWETCTLSDETLKLVLAALSLETEEFFRERTVTDAKNVCVLELYRRTGEESYLYRRLQELPEECGDEIAEFLQAALTQNGFRAADGLLNFLEEHKEIREAMDTLHLEGLRRAFFDSLEEQPGKHAALRERAEELWQEAYRKKREKRLAML